MADAQTNLSPRALLLAGIGLGLALACRFASDEGATGVPPVTLFVTPESLVFRGRAGDTVLPDRYLTLSFVDNVSGRWSAFENGSWFFLPTTEDTLPFFLTVAPRPAGLGSGTYAASIWIVAVNDTVRVPVLLELSP
ncbi:MAG: hypothetical protein DMD54_01110 [Gemmatimonadetes bacterium]|nr:MAG: hypothetical protein DMD54_01110 [Gemmatimonadota bacterium]